jgi:hypothetical protein
VAGVPILRLLQGRAFDPEAVQIMVTAFEDTLRELKLANREDPIVERVARVIIECAERLPGRTARRCSDRLNVIEKGEQPYDQVPSGNRSCFPTDKFLVGSVRP